MLIIIKDKSTLILIILLVFIAVFASQIQDVVSTTGQASSQVKCTSDTDGGLKYETKGTITMRYYTWFGKVTTKKYTDLCVNAQTLREYYCGGNYKSPWKDYACPNGCLNGACKDSTQKTISVGSIDLQKPNFSFDNARTKLNSLLSAHPDTELIVTPEFLFYYGREADPVIINCESGICNINSVGTTKSNELKEIIKYFQNTARHNNTNIVLGTVSERIVIDGINVSISTQLIINRNGNIIGKHRAAKKAEFYSEEISNCGENQIFCDKIYQAQLETVRTFDLTNNRGESFGIIPVICGEKGDDNFINLLSNSNVDIAVLSEFDRDCDYEATTLRIQNGVKIGEIPDNVCASVIVHIMQDWIDNTMLKQNSYWLISNAGDIGQTGIISWNMNKIEDLEITNDYIYGKINLG